MKKSAPGENICGWYGINGDKTSGEMAAKRPAGQMLLFLWDQAGCGSISVMSAA
jgi:hypothetical protein